MNESSRHETQWVNLHPLWLTLSRYNVPGDKWTAWNQYARRNGVSETVAMLHSKAQLRLLPAVRGLGKAEDEEDEAALRMMEAEEREQAAAGFQRHTRSSPSLPAVSHHSQRHSKCT